MAASGPVRRVQRSFHPPARWNAGVHHRTDLRSGGPIVQRSLVVG